MVTLRTFTNRPGVVYDSAKTTVIFAEDLNAVAEKVDELLGLATGPAGADGTNGTNGTDGVDGADGADGVDGASYTRALQNLTNVATVTPTGLTDEHINISALAQNLTIANPSGTLAEGQMLTIRIKPDATPRTLTFGSKYLGFGATIPTTTVASKKMLLGCIYNAGLDKVELVSVVNES